MIQDAAVNAYHKLSQIAYHRSDLYGIFSVAFTNPTHEFIAVIQNGELVRKLEQNLSALSLEKHRYESALQGLVEVGSKDDDKELVGMLSKLRVEYMRLFVGPRNPVTPIYETYYPEHPTVNNDSPLLFVGPAAVAVGKQYQKAGIKMATQDSPDHFTIELEFLSRICDKESGAWNDENNAMGKKWRRMEQQFLDDHLGKWGLTFCRQIQEHTEEPFYRHLAALAETYLYMETSAFRPA